MRRFTPALLLLLATTAGCQSADSGNTTAAVAAGTALGIDRTKMDTSVKPGDDFYAYANGTWQRTAEIPADRSNIGSFLQAFLETEKHLNELIGGIVKSNPAAGTPEARIANFYNAYMNAQAIEAAGMKPIEADLARFAAIQDKAKLSEVLGSQVRADVDPLNATNYQTENLFGIFVSQGLATPDVIPYILQGGLGLPEREYYLSGDAKMADIRKAYQAYIAKLLGAAGIADADAKAQRILDLETKIARAHATREESEDFTKSATLWTRDDLTKKAPGIDWPAFLNAAQLGSQNKFGAYHARAITGLSALVASEPLDTWKDWLAFHQISMNAAVLPSAIDNARFAFYGTTLAGTPQQQPREKRALAALNANLGDAVGKAYVDKYFPASAKAEVQGMVENIKNAFATRVQALDWMAPSTKEEAIRKVKTIAVGVGYPDNWRDYSGLTIAADSAYANGVNARRAAYANQLAKIGKPQDKNEWWMSPQTINAVNLPVQNAMNFPAAILQPPFFDPRADAAYNYGAIGAVIGHEISHSFDNNGAAFDSTGALRNWWTPADLKRFNQAGDALAKQYDTYRPFPDLAVNGRLTLGENIADVAGLEAAYEAYRASLNGKEAPVIDGFTGDQRFFIAFAQTWATKMREATLRARIATDGHAPGNYRALTVRNIDAWYKAFDVKPGDKLYLAPEQRVKVW